MAFRAIKNKKGEGMAMQKIIILVIVVLVLIAVVIFLNKANLTQWVKNLPGYSSGEDKEIDITQTSDVARAMSCVVKVGRTASATGSWTRSRNSLSVFDSQMVLQPLEDIYWYVELQTIEDIDPFPDVVLGNVIQTGGNYKISLNSAGTSHSNPLVRNLEGAYLISGTGEICKMGTVTPQTTTTSTGK